MTSELLLLGAIAVGFLLVIRYYENDLARERRRNTRLTAKVARLEAELDESIIDLDGLLLAASVNRHPANTPTTRRPAFAIITGGAS